MRLDTPMGECCDHLDSERSGLDHDGLLHGIESLIPLHGLANVLDVVQAIEVTPRNPGIRVPESGRDDERVVRHGLPVEYLNRLLCGVD